MKTAKHIRTIRAELRTNNVTLVLARPATQFDPAMYRFMLNGWTNPALLPRSLCIAMLNQAMASDAVFTQE